MKNMLCGFYCFVLIISLTSCTYQFEKPTQLQSSSSVANTSTASVNITNPPMAIISPENESLSPSPAISAIPEFTDDATEPYETDESINPDYTEEPHVAPEYGIADMKKAGLSNEQYEKIYSMLYAASNAGLYLKGTNRLTDKDYLHFCFWALNELSYNNFYTNIVIGTDIETNNCYVNRTAIQKILQSAFGIRYTSNYTGDYDDIGIYRKSDRFLFCQVEGGFYEFPYAYKMEKLTSGRIRISLDIITSGCEDSGFTAKAEAIIQEDKNSIFGYRLISYKKVRIAEPKFIRATASSYLPSKSNKSYAAKNLLDRDNKTFWVSEKGKSQWIMISSTKVQTVSGIIVRYEDMSEVATINANGCSTVNIEFSDGSSFETNSFDNYVSFGRAVKTNYIKITVIPNAEYDDPNVGYYIADIIPY